MVGEDGPQSHRPGMQYGFMAKTTKTCMSMDNLNLLPYHNIPKDGEEGEDGGKSRGAVNDEERDMVDFEAIRKVSYARSPIVCMSDDNDFMSAIDELRRELIDVTLDSSWLGKEEVANHCNVVWHGS